MTDKVYVQIFTGFYPAIYDKGIKAIDYYDQYIATYVERDLKQISKQNGNKVSQYNPGKTSFTTYYF
ncbi:MAG: hypothetical protein COU68_04260 [Candidatus Pacebacteria bacterium CG10_big_fil_rev_8_21_14_0_10_45_6]|nr:MAG: hypothetical protein COU68_04260 [Candidatus Pacebacteria bacterium CG10_big_fil_rev_8_21_14_0_10_45_6]